MAGLLAEGVDLDCPACNVCCRSTISHDQRGDLMAGAILGGAPAWVYVLLFVLIALGIRRLKVREVPIIVALIPVFAFSAWSVVAVARLVTNNGSYAAVAAWLGGLLFGVISALVLPEARATRTAGGRVCQPASWSPLVLYLTVFVGRFACGAWAAIEPDEAVTANAIGTAIGAATTARLIMSVMQWGKETAIPSNLTPKH
jgi:hypothetical protein